MIYQTLKYYYQWYCGKVQPGHGPHRQRHRKHAQIGSPTVNENGHEGPDGNDAASEINAFEEELAVEQTPTPTPTPTSGAAQRSTCTVLIVVVLAMFLV